MKISLQLFFGFVFFMSTSLVHAQSVQERVELMKYAIRMEGALPHETKWEVSWLEKFKLIEEAYAYKEGETCLILGFKSQFKNGMCRLSSAEGIKEYKKECAGGYLPCNPQIFGKPSSEKPFCVSQSSGTELSKSCAKETIQHVAKTSKSPVLKDIAAKNLKNFDLGKLDLSKIDPALNEAFTDIFKNSDSTLDAATKFTQELCEDLKVSTKSGHQPLDLKACESQLALLKNSNATFANEPKVVADKKSNPKPPQEEVCEEPVLDKKTEENIKDVQVVTEKGDAQAWLACVNQIEAHKIIAPKIKGMNDFNKERDRYHGYWHQLDGEKQFGILCNFRNDEGPETFTFLGPKGFKQAAVPRDEVSGAENVARISSNGKEYYIVQDIVGNYFELVPKDKLTSWNSGTQDDVKRFHKKGKGGLTEVKSVPVENLNQAKSCVKERIDEYASWITYPYGILPNVKDYNKDVGVLNGGGDLKPKYSKTVAEIKKEQFAGILKDVPDCKDILSEEDWSKQYDKEHADRIDLYNKMRGNLGLPN